MPTATAAIAAAAIPDDGLSFFSLVSILITLAAVSSYINYRYIRLPTRIGVMLVAFFVSLTLTYFVVVFSILVQGLTIGRVIRRTTIPSPAGTESVQ